MTSIPLIDLFIIVYVLVDDWYQQKGKRYLQDKPSARPAFTDSEVITLMLMQDFVPFPSESQYIGYIRANYLPLFPKLLTQSQFNRRARNLRLLVEKLHQHWIQMKALQDQSCFLLDTKPVPVLGYKRSKHQSYFLGSADYGHCVSRKLNYFGYKLVTISTLLMCPSSMTWCRPTPMNARRQKR